MKMRKLIAPLLAAALFYSCNTDSPNEAADIDIPADMMGLVHGGSRTSIGESWVKAQFDELERIGVKWILDDFTWSTIQPTENTWNFDGSGSSESFDTYVKNANSRGIKILGLLTYDTAWLHGGRALDEHGNPKSVQIPDKNLPNILHNVAIYNDGTIGRNIDTPEKRAKYSAYAKAAVERYNGGAFGKVDAWGIWNEPDLFPRFWTGTREDFFKLSIEAAETIRNADNNGAPIIAGGFSSTASDEWIRGFYTSGAAKSADFAAFHPYSLTPNSTASIFQSFVDRSDRNFQNRVWVTEVGHPTTGSERNNQIGYGTEVHIDSMPQTIVKTVVLLATRGAQKIFWYHLADPVNRRNSDSEDWFGLYQRDAERNLIPKGRTEKGELPEAYRLVAHNIPGKTWRESGLPGLRLPEDVQSYYFEGSDGRRTLVIWNDSFFDNPIINITLPGTGHVLHDPYTATSQAVPASYAYTLSRRNDLDEKILFFTWNE